MVIDAQSWKKVADESGVFQNQSQEYLSVRQSIAEPTDTDGLLIKPGASIVFDAGGSGGRDLWAYNKDRATALYFFETDS